MSQTSIADPRPVVLLYNPRAVFFTMPLALLAIGSNLDPERYRVVIIDGRLEEDPFAALEPWLEEALCVGVTVLTGRPIQDALDISRKVREASPSLPIIWGGWHPSMFGAACLDEPAVDLTVQGQGEESFAEIVDRIATDQGLAEISGTTCRGADGAAVAHPPRPLADLEDLRAHDYSLIAVERYFKLKGKRQLDFISSQGCHFRCAFCADPFVYERQWKGLSAETLVDRLLALHETYRFDDLNFQDETFFTGRARIAEIAGRLVAAGSPFSWAATMRADQCARLSDAELATCRASGLRRVLVGVESGSQETIDRIRKDIRLEQVVETGRRCAALGILVQFPFIVGFPDEPDESIDATMKLALELGDLHPGFETPIFHFRPYPGTELTRQAEAAGHSLPCTLEDWADFDFVSSRGPWVSDVVQRRVAAFLFYQRLSRSGAPAPIRRLARWRIEREDYRFPIAQAVDRVFNRRPRLA